MRRVVHLTGPALLAVGLLAAFSHPLQAMVRQWQASPMYSHAFTVPFISLGLLWSARHRFLAYTPRPAWLAGGLIVAAALTVLMLGEIAAVQIAQQLAFVLTIAGVVLFLFGFTYLKLAGPAVAYLLFMVPFWDAFTEPLHAPFQQNSARLGVALMHAVGVPAFREGTIIALPNVVIEVARECSGVNYLIAVLALALPLAFLRLRSNWRRFWLIATSMAIAALANGLRVALIGTLAYLEIGSPLHGPFHVLHGLFVAGIGYVVLFVGLHFLEEPAPGTAATPPADGARPRTLWRPADAYGLALVFWILVVVGIAPVSTPVALARPLESLPSRLGPWVAQTSLGDAPVPTTAWAGADQQFRRQYRAADGTVADVDIWYFAQQRQSREIVSYQVAGLHQRATPRQIALSDGTTITANLVTWPERNTVGLFWYEIGGTPESREYAAKLRSVWSVITSGRSNAAAVMLTTAAPPPRRDAAAAALVTLAAQLHHELAPHWLSQRTSPDTPSK